MKKHDTTPPNAKSGKEVAKQTDFATSPKSKFSPKFWETRIFRPTYTRDGQRCQVQEWWARIQSAGRREAVSLATNDRQEAGRKAARLYQRVKAAGWDVALAEFAPDRATAKGVPTLGDFITAASAAKAADVSPRTLRDYGNACRHLVAMGFGIKADPSRFDYRTGGLAAWNGKIDRIRLDRITAAKIQAAVNKRIADARTNPIHEKRTRFTLASFVRQAKALFNADMKGQFADAPNPFADVSAPTPRPSRYQSTVDAGALLRDAKAELAEGDAEAYKAFLLAIGAGLRKGEIDSLQWQHIDAKAGVIRVLTTDVSSPKTDSSEGEVFVDAGLIAELDQFRAGATSLFVLESKMPPRAGLSFDYYRAEKAFDRLAKWLRSKGMLALKPIHALRKEFGSLVNQSSDIHTASRQLRHSGIAITSAFYADNRKRIAPAIGEMLAAKPETATAAK